MANIASVEKRARQAVKRHARNSALRSRLRTVSRKLSKVLAEKNIEQIKIEAPKALREFDKMVSKNIIHKNSAARNKSRIMAKVRIVIPDYQVTSWKA